MSERGTVAVQIEPEVYKAIMTRFANGFDHKLFPEVTMAITSGNAIVGYFSFTSEGDGTYSRKGQSFTVNPADGTFILNGNLWTFAGPQ